METHPSDRNDATSLAGYSILIVEDDYFVAKEAAMILREHGAQVLGPPSLRRAAAHSARRRATTRQ